MRTRRTNVGRAAVPLNILILGGTGFTGPEQVDYALERGHRVTLFNRGRTRPGMFRGKVHEELIGDLNNNVEALKGKSFDVVIDNPTTMPLWVRNVAQHMAGHTGHYIFISTLSAYSTNAQPNQDEETPIIPLPDGFDAYGVKPEDARRSYGILKSESEREVARKYPGIHTIIRPGLIVGPLDVSDRFTYWPVRINKGGEVLVPGNPNDPVQIIDSRDLAEWTIRMAENRTFGTYNGVGPHRPMPMAEMVGGIKAITTAGAQFTWVPAEFLTANGVRAWSGKDSVPVWMNPAGRNVGFSQWSNARAVKAGLTYRPLAVTAKDVLDWHKTRPAEQQKALDDGMVAGLSATKEAEVLAAWRTAAKPA
jgi:2'-hydroxyisoflavone reductase